jgi:hypothetical protein
MAVKYTDAQIRNLFPTYFDAAATATRIDEDIIRKILKMYSDKEGGRTYIGKKLKFDQSVIGRIINKAIEKNIVKEVPPSQYKTKEAQRIYKPGESRKIYREVRPITANDRKIFSDIPKNAKWKVQIPFRHPLRPGQKTQTTTKMVYTPTKSAAENALTKADKLTEISKLEKAKPYERAVRDIHKIALKSADDINSVDELAEAVYGKAKNSKDLLSKQKLIARDLVRYQEFLLGFKPVPGLVIPVGEKLDNIISEFPAMNQWGRFAGGAIRDSKLKIRDQLLKTKGPQLIALRKNILKFIDSGAMELDEAMGVSATYERAPGYTELGQVIKKGINTRKGREIDNPFSRLFEKVVAGETTPTIMHNKTEIGIKEFNKLSRDFQKKWKVDTPIIEYKPGEVLEPSKFVKHFDKLSPEARANVTQLAEKGIALRSRALPMEALLASFNGSSNAEKVKTAVALRCVSVAEGGRIGYALGSATINCVNTKLTEQPVQSSMRLRVAEGVGKIKPAATNFLKLLGRGGLKAAPLAAAAAVGAVIEPLVKQFVADDPNTYLTNENQMKGMLLATIEGETPKVDDEILKWQMPALGAATAAGAIPGAREAYLDRLTGRGPAGPAGTKLPATIPNKPVGKVRAALGIKGVLGKALGATFSPLATAATLPISIAAQRAGGTDYGDIATDPTNWMGPAFMGKGAEMASKGITNPTLLKALRMGISPRTLSLISRRFGMPGLAVSAGMWGYDKWKNRSINDED